MPFDGIVTNAITKELKETLIGGRINKIYQPTKTEVLITIRNKRKNHALLLSIHPSYARFHLTDDTYQNPAEPPMFCMLLRKHLAGAIVLDIVQKDLERIISFTFRAVNEIGDFEVKTLQVEIMGRHSNVILLNEDKSKIINCLKHVPPFQNRHRSLVPGADYVLPPTQGKLSLLDNDVVDMVGRLDFNKGNLNEQLIQTITGLSKIVGTELVYRAHLGSQSIYMEQLKELQQTVLHSGFHFAFYGGKREDFHVIPLTHLQERQTFLNANQLVDAFYSNKAERDRVKQQAKDLSRIMKNELDKNKRKLMIHETTIKKASSAEKYKIEGELLTANMHAVTKGDAMVSVIDFYDPEQNERTIHLQTDKTPSENAQTLFKKYRKLQAAQTRAITEIQKTKQEIDYLEDIVQQIVSARDEDIADIREELAEEGYLKKQKSKKRKKQLPKPEQFTSTDGTTIYVGRNNKQNEYVTQKVASKNDTWLHTLNIPGSHVIIKHEEPSQETLEEAAVLAAYFSKAKASASVPVDYTKVKYVKKPSGAKPGFVTYTEQKTLYVTPEEGVVQALKMDKH
jgi:predicted ribosome quality control (RQC) complex YloA/Tae2 family protein